MGRVLACEQFKVLSYTWSYQIDEAMRGEKPSRVTFLLERVAANPELVKLTVTHDEFPDNSVVFPQISSGWPMVLSGLKTLCSKRSMELFFKAVAIRRNIQWPSH
jgi:Activator of Hsp90 ATPase homolog 1-like protein